MKDRPILFSAPMVRALLDGSKTQTRRVVKPQPDAWTGGTTLVKFTPDDRRLGRLGVAIPCPYGQPGDRLWVRESWDAGGSDIGYRADMSSRYVPPDHPHSPELLRMFDRQRGQWRPSIHMPRWASRITLEITGVRVERLQDISVDDCMAEGVAEWNSNLRGLVQCMEWRYVYEDLWRSINGPGSWDANPWVWVVEFKREARA